MLAQWYKIDRLIQSLTCQISNDAHNGIREMRYLADKAWEATWIRGNPAGPGSIPSIRSAHSVLIIEVLTDDNLGVSR